MALLDDILKWTETNLTPWQRDAARRLFEQDGALSDEDYVQLHDLLKAAHGLPNATNFTPVPLAAAHLPAAMKPGETIVLKAMRDLEHVNRVATAQLLTFSPEGLTVIYGGNGSGKSGYGRVLKRACRARDNEGIHPDATDPAAKDHVPRATFDVEIGTVARSLKWEYGEQSPDELSTIAVFDSHCARAYLTAEQDIAYLPYGLDVVENLANKVLPELTRRLTVEIEGANVDRQPFDHLLGDTKVGRMIADLSAKTDPTVVTELATLSETEANRLATLERALSEADPIAKAKELRLSAERLKDLVIRLEDAVDWVSDEAVARLKSVDDASQMAAEVERLAAQALRSNENLLPGTGEPAWKTLFEAARRFSTEVAYPAHTFPHTDAGAVCPLCQQELTDGAERLERFDQYIQYDSAQMAADKRKQLEKAKTELNRVDLALRLGSSLKEELTGLDDSVVSEICNFEAAITLRRDAMLKATETHSWDAMPTPIKNPRQHLRDLAARQLGTARTFQRASDEAKQKELKEQRDELQSRKALAASLTAVLALVERMKLKSSLEKCKNDLKTRPISDKSKELASDAVTGTLKTALDDEFKRLGIAQIKTKLKERNVKGKMMVQLLLDLPTRHKLNEILSEGEQRAIAIASFLAEIRLANHSGGIVFDDPVSSLDHWRRQDVAKRLVDEATRRQVIVFTHDTSFLGQLRDELDATGVSHSIQSLEWRDSSPGHVNIGLPWEHQKYTMRIDKLEQAQKQFTRLPWPSYPNEAQRAAMRHQYDLFRATIERVVQDVVFNGVVERYRDWIQVSRLREVVGFNATEHSEITKLYQLAHDVVDAHDPSSAKAARVPTAHEFGLDIQALKNVIAAIKDRRKAAKAGAGGSSRTT